MKQFYYTTKEMLPPKEGDKEPQFKEYLHSFAIDYVVRSIETETGERVVILDDFKEFNQDIPQKPTKTHPKDFITKRNFVQSEIYLNKEDAERFVNLTKLD